MKDTPPILRTQRTSGLWVGLGLFLVLVCLPTLGAFRETATALIALQPGTLAPDVLARGMQCVAALAVLIIVLWVTEAVPLPVTGLLPLVVLPLLHVTGLSRGPFPLTLANVAPGYANPVIFLFLGGFLLAGALQKWGIDRRLTLWLLTRGRISSGPRTILLAVMGVTGFLSMWISNTATAAMMLPIGLGILATLGASPGTSRFGTAMMLGIAWSASIGGIGTPIGTPPNGIALGVLNSTLGQDPAYHRITFVGWMGFGVPYVLLCLPLAWLLLLKLFPPESPAGADVKARLLEDYRALGRLSKPQRRVMGLFLLAAALWILLPFRQYLLPAGISAGLEWIDEYTVGILAGVLLFFVPSGRAGGEKLLGWDDTRSVDWGTLLLFGGGIALSDAMFKTGLASWLTGSLMQTLHSSSTLILLGGVVLISAILTELASNTAVATMMAPVVITLAQAGEAPPQLLVVGSALASSLAFMLPVSTPPNALVYGTGYIRIGQMVRSGVLLDVLGGALAAALLYAVWLFLPGLLV